MAHSTEKNRHTEKTDRQTTETKVEIIGLFLIWKQRLQHYNIILMFVKSSIIYAHTEVTWNNFFGDLLSAVKQKAQTSSVFLQHDATVVNYW